jgi:K+-sensing histidine kinase KdpD
MATQRNAHLQHADEVNSTALRLQSERVLSLWMRRARLKVPAAAPLDEKTLLDSLPVFLQKLEKALASPVPSLALQQEEYELARIHGAQRSRIPAYTLDQVIYEYHLLSEVLFEVLEEQAPLTRQDRDIILSAIHIGTRNAGNEFARAQLEPGTGYGFEARSPIFNCVFSIMVVAIAAALQYLIWPVVAPAPYLLFYPAVIVAALYGNGVLATLLSVLAAQYFFLPPIYSFHMNWPVDPIRHLLFIGSGLMITALTSAIRSTGVRYAAIARDEASARRRADEANRNSVAFARRHQALADLGQQALVNIELGELMNDVVRELARVIDVEFASILVFSPQKKSFDLVAGCGWAAGVVGELTFSSDAGSMSGYTLRSGAPVVLKDLRTESRFKPAGALLEHGVRSGVSMIIPGREHPYGVLAVYTSELREFTEQDVGFLKGVTAILTATVERRQAEEALARILSREQLEREGAEVAAQQLRLERDLREQFVSSLTHDLRTPLTAAQMSAQLISRHLEHPEKIQSYASRIVHNIRRADQMIRDLLDANQIRAGQKLPIDRNACELGEVIETTVDELTTVHGTRFSFRKPDEKLEGSWDCAALRRVIENLCGNAVKYGSAKTPITLSVRRTDPAHVRLSVHNWGTPIPPGDREQLFEYFHRSQSAQQSGAKGWGIGLVLVKGVAEAHGGTVDVESSTEQGTTFSIELPIA